MRRREFLGILGGAAAAWPLAARAQQPAKVARIGYLGATSAFDQASWVEALRSGLRDLGYVEGKNFVIEFRWAEGRYDRLPVLAAELVGLKVDVLVTHGTPGTRAAKQATTTVPIIMAVAGDAVATGVIPSLARPGGNVTGSTFFHPDITAKRVGLLKEAIPHARKVAVLLNPNNPVIGPGLQALEGAAEFLKVELQTFEARGPDEIESAFSAMAKRSIDALTIIDDTMLIGSAQSIADIASMQRLPSIGFTEFARAGGMMGYGVRFPDFFRRAAVFVDKILRGTKPADLPVEQPTRFELVINLRTAGKLGLKLPTAILLRADELIE